MAEKKPNQGYLNKNTFKKHEKQPDCRGKIPVDVDFIESLAENSKSGEGAFVTISGWSGKSQRSGDPYVFLKLEANEYNKGAFKGGNGAQAPVNKPDPVADEDPFGFA